MKAISGRDHFPDRVVRSIPACMKSCLFKITKLVTCKDTDHDT